MKTVSARQANHDFSELLLRVERGEELTAEKRFALVRSRRTVARLAGLFAVDSFGGSFDGRAADFERVVFAKIETGERLKEKGEL